ncbi:unnamed protein product, partial [Didymodactylos carnosus]
MKSKPIKSIIPVGGSIGCNFPAGLDLEILNFLDALEKANVKLNAAKCSIAHKQLDYLGYRITPDGIKPTTTNVKKTIDFPTPTSIKAAYSFIQMAQFRFIKDFSTIAAPLNMFKNKNVKFEWTPECEQSFNILKQKLSQYPLLAFHDGKSKLKLKNQYGCFQRGNWWCFTAGDTRRTSPT